MSRNAPPARRDVDKPAPRAALLAWYDRHARALPWRAPPGAERNDLYRIWLSEVMLQQTTVPAVAPHFEKFIAAWPDVAALAAAPREDVLRAWAGLGYYSRARNLHAAALILARDGFPRDEAGWRALPGVGAYTAAAIAAIGLGLPANVVDGNVERVMARLHAVETPLPDAKAALTAHAQAYVSADRPGDWAQALMDLGATVCTPAAPKCMLCPLSADCAAFARGDAETFPRKRAKAERPQRFGAAFALMHEDALLIVRRPDKGLLGGMRALPTTDWGDAALSMEEALRAAPRAGAWTHAGAVRHAFTHFALTLDVYALRAAARGEGEWLALEEAGLPTVFRKAAVRALGAPAPESRRRRPR